MNRVLTYKQLKGYFVVLRHTLWDTVICFRCP